MWREAGEVVVPLALGVALVLWVASKRLVEGASPFQLPLDRKFLTAILYTGALLAIYLSCLYFGRLLLRRPQGPATAPEPTASRVKTPIARRVEFAASRSSWR